MGGEVSMRDPDQAITMGVLQQELANPAMKRSPL
jgi:hypothetical protein